MHTKLREMTRVPSSGFHYTGKILLTVFILTLMATVGIEYGTLWILGYYANH
jgi:hypothetical protein